MSRLMVGLLTVALLAITTPVGAQTPSDADLLDEGLVRLDSIEAGALLFQSDEFGWYVPAPTLDTDISISVSGPIARVQVTQEFRNVSGTFVEGKYVFPLPEGSAVDTLRMKVGNRWIEGSIAEREEARIIYEEAKATGQVASLVEQERPNVFTTSVANIAPGDRVIVQIEYLESLAPRNGRFGLRLPLVVAPRYDPGNVDQWGQQIGHELVLGSEGWLEPSYVEGQGRIYTPVVDPRSESGAALQNPVEISIDLDAGFPLGHIESLYHDISVDRRTENSASVVLTGRPPADRDFYVSWAPIDLDEPYATAFTEYHENDTHIVTVLTPPSSDHVETITRPREVIFVQDTSGSMGGDSLKQAKVGLIAALERLTEQDVFNITEFNTYFSTFADEPVQATPTNIARAVAWVNDLVATNGTQMRPALEDALNDRTPNDGRLRQVIFLTDGAVSNELQMLELIELDLGTSRLFTVGIGSAPNSYFMSAAARAGRGASVFIGDLSEVNEQMQALFAKIESPAVVDLAIADLPANVSVSPSPIPDLYVGDPVVLTLQVPQGVTVDLIELTGTRGTESWQLDVDLAGAEIRPGVSKLWAREHIRDLEALRSSPLVTNEQREELDDTVLATALEFGLVSRLTSLVAVDVEITRPAGEDSTSVDVPLNLPDGWDPDIFFDNASGNASADPFAQNLAQRLEVAETNRAAADAAGGGLGFAATGGDWQVRTFAGLGLIAAGAVALVVTGRRRDDD